MPDNIVISCRDLVKNFKGPSGIINALKDISFEITKGSITGLLGPDGAGKTTLLRILSGLYRPDGGTVSVLDMDTVKDAARIQSEIGYMPQKFGLYETLSVAENMNLYAQLYMIPPDVEKKKSEALLEMTKLANFTGRPAGKLSGGMKQKLALACTLLSDPPLLLLDEPTVGVDVVSRRELWKILQKLSKEEGMTLLVSTAYLDEADYCDRTIILYEGKILADDKPAAIVAKAANVKPKATFEDGFLVELTGSVPPPLERKSKGKFDETVIKVKDLVKKFGDFTAVDHLNFEVKKGEIFGLLGANGAGKTTTFRMMCGLSASNGGTLEINGFDMEKSPENVRSSLGYVAQKFSLYGDLSVYDNLEFFGAAYGLRKQELKDAIAAMLKEFGMENYAAFNAGKLPLGYKQRLGMACALIHNPAILFLDEATSGADPQTRREFWQRIINLADRGVCIIITTHFMDEAAWCDKVVIMVDGKTAAEGTPEDILKRGKSDNYNDAFANLLTDAGAKGDG